MLDERIESLEGLDKQERYDNSRLDEMAEKLAELEVKLSLLQEYVRSRLR